MSATPTNGIHWPSLSAPAEIDQVMTVLRQQVLRLCGEADRTPSTVRVAAHDIVVEVSWPEAGQIVAAPAPRPASPVVSSPAQPSSVPASVVPAAQVPAAPAHAAEDTGTFPLCAATVGVFYQAPEPGAKPFVAVGDTIRPGQQVAIIEAMKLMIPVEADRAGRVVEVLVADGTSVEHGQPLLVLAPVDARGDVR